ncbi:MAG: CBS domain-containing protein [Patescibacteria group bacterium]|nr:CBS domain-containing protein [Patescibacteria group bacterium]
MKVKNLMRLKPKTVYLDTPVERIWDLISHEQIHMVPVLDKENEIQGIITAEDLLINLVPNYREFFTDFYPTSPTLDDVEKKLADNIDLTAKDVMNRTVYTVYGNHDVFKALSRMLAYNKRILPVIDKREKLIGFIVEKDIFKYLFTKQKKIFSGIKRGGGKVKVDIEDKSEKSLLKLKKNIQKTSKYLKFLRSGVHPG